MKTSHASYQIKVSRSCQDWTGSYRVCQTGITKRKSIQIKTAEREAFFEHNKKLSARFYHLTGYNVYGYDVDDYNRLNEVFVEVDNRQLELDIAEAHLFIFYLDEEFINWKGALNKQIIEYEN
jgi:hypothetical protein